MLECSPLNALAGLRLAQIFPAQSLCLHGSGSMPGCTFTRRMLRALSLTFLMVWLWQTSALLTGIEAPPSVTAAGAIKGQSATSCMLCTADNQSSSTADHAHEPPSLVTATLAPAFLRSPLPVSNALDLEPLRFIEPIERPPRTLLLI